MALGATSIVIGIIWDISWHMSIGRDTFWTPAHIAIYFGGIVCGCVGGWLALQYTFFPTPEQRASSVNVFGARAPLGAWVAIWGALAMLTAGPFDDWWHNAYGLDVKIISPPHSLLGLGMLGVSAGALLLTLAQQNRGTIAIDSGLFIYVGGLFLTFGVVFIMEFTQPNMQHSLVFYKACSLIVPLRLVTMSRASRVSWPATRVAALYVLITCLMIWTLQLFPAQPKLAPIYNPITHMVPPAFPLLLIVPALGIDLYLRNEGNYEDGWLRLRTALRAMALGALFLALLMATQWFFAEFLLSPKAANWFFVGDRHWSYGAGPGIWRSEFWSMGGVPPGEGLFKFGGLGLCWLFASFNSWLGLLWGGWMRKVKR